MHTSKWLRTVCFLLACSLLIGVLVGCKVMPDEGGITPDGTNEPSLPQPKTLSDPREIELNSAIQKAASGREDVLAFIVFRITIDHVVFSKDESLALVWFSMVDKQTGLVQNSEPGIVIAHATGDAAQPWRITFQVDPSFAAELMAVPDTMISEEARALYMPAVQQQPKDGVVYTGYRLPWTKGMSVTLTGSIGHVFTYKSCPSTCLYAFDFANGTMFDIKAAKHGYVKYYQDSYANGNTTDTNYIVLVDPSTAPATYQVYYHLAQGSIPAALKKAGAEVMQGQFIGKADDTGYSTGNHLHFHVHTSPNSIWGTSVDIVFDEVAVNNGRPRTCTESSSYPEYGSQCVSGNKYISQNGDVAPPTGAITSPLPYATVTSPTLNVSGWMHDDTAVKSAQIMINTGKAWTPIGSLITTTPFTQEINLCNPIIPDGKFFLSLEITDKAGKVSIDNQGLTELTKSYTCPPLPPACIPEISEVALYTETDYQGICMAFPIGDFDNLSNSTIPFLDNARSIMVGNGVSALLFPDVSFGGNYELFQDGDSDLANNVIGANNAASMKVISRVNPPEPPTLNLPEIITASYDLTLAWTSAAGEQTRSTLSGPQDYSQTLEWQDGTSWQIGLLPEGDYIWTVEARNLAGTATITQEFTVAKATVLPLSHLTPLPQVTNSSAVLLTWEVDQGVEGIDHFEIQTSNPGGEWVDLAEQPAASARELIYWGTPGQTVQFRMRAVDIVGNAEEYLSVPETSTLFVDSCIMDAYEGADPGDDDISGASMIEVGIPVSHNWCAPASRGDGNQNDNFDWISFTGVTGDQLRFTTDAMDIGSAALLTLYDVDGATFIGEARPVNSNASASLDWTVPVDGTYYIKLERIDNRIRGTDTLYEVGIELKSKIQPGTLVCGAASLPALLAAGYALNKQAKKIKKKHHLEAMGR
jgi:murein DD-endopeptidase MepM/ murein hydrolase activator NlpD